MDSTGSQDTFRARGDTANGAGAAQEECQFLSPTLSDILSDDRILRFYQCVKDIKTQRSPRQTAAMFFALCHALGDSVTFLKVHQIPKVLFRQEQQVFAVNVADTQHDSGQLFNSEWQFDPLRMAVAAVANTSGPPTSGPQTSSSSSPSVLGPPPTSTSSALLDHNSHTNSLLSAAVAAAAAAAEGSPQQLLQAALASVSSPATAADAASSGIKRKNNTGAEKDPTKRAKKASPRDKEYSVRRNEIIQDLLKVSDVDLIHQANTVDNEVKMIIQGQERNTEFGMSSPLHRFATLANLAAHYDSDFAPKNAGVYFNYEYFQLFLAYRDLELERQQQQGLPNSDPRPVMVQCRSDIERVLVNTNWEAIRRRLTIGERICQVCGITGRGFLLLSKQVSGRKLLHNFNTGEWAEFMREFQRPENQALLQTLQAKYAPERFYGSPAIIQEPAPVVEQADKGKQPLASETPSTSSTSNSHTAEESTTVVATASTSSANQSQPKE